MNGSSVYDYELLPGVYAQVDESCWHPLFCGGSTGPDRPSRPCSADYAKPHKEPVTPRPLDRPLPLAYRLASGWRMLYGAERWDR